MSPKAKATPKKTSAKAKAPATVGNVAVGFDILGYSIGILYDEVEVNIIKDKTVKVEEVDTSQIGSVEIPTETKKNTSAQALQSLMETLDLDHGFSIKIKKGIPLASGMGGSAASAVAAVFAANSLLEKPLSKEALFAHAIEGEKVSSGSTHGDNVAPSLFGGMVLVTSITRPSIDIIPLPNSIFSIVVHPHIEINTREARSILKPEISLKDHIAQSSYLAGFLTGALKGHVETMGRHMKDIIIEPQRSALIPGFTDVRKEALRNGAIGMSISGAGPSVFAWARNQNDAESVKNAMISAFKSKGIESDGYVGPIDDEGVTITS